jgi:multidrug efflux pump
MPQSVFDTPVERPILAASLNLLLIALGIGALLSLPIREYPDIDPPTVSVRTQYVGAPAEVVEREITKIIEDNLSGIEGVRQIQSTSRNEASSINIEFTAGTDINAAAADVRDKVSSVRNELPDDVEEPTIEKANADDQPMMWITLRSDELKPPELTDVAERLITDAVGVVPGVARIQIGGEKRYAMRIWLDRRAMAARGVTPTDVAERLRAENIEVPAGRLETGTQELTLRAETRFADAAEFANLVLRDVRGDRVTLGQVARVEVGVEEYRSGLRANGREAISLGIIRQSNANTLAVASGVRDEIDRVRASIPNSIDMSVDYDESVFIRETLVNVATTLAQVIAIVVLVIWLFLGSLRATLIPAATIPASVIPAFLAAAAMGFSINTLSILAVILAISLCTDDAVVIIENIRRRQQGGEPVLVASVRATRQVGFATFASAAVLIAVILPLAFISGNVGRLFREFAVVLAAVVAFSTFAALTLSPMLASKLFARGERQGRVAAWVDDRLKRLGTRYEHALDRSIARPLLPVAAALAILGAGVAAFLTIPNEVAPEEDRGSLRVRVEGPEGAGFAYTDARVREVEKLLSRYVETPEDRQRREAGEDVPEKPVVSMLTIVAPGFGGASNTNSAFVIVRLKDWGDREIGQSEFQQKLRRELAQISGVRAFATGSATLGQRRRGQQLQFVLGGIDRAEVRRWANTLLDRAKSIEGLQNPDIDYKDTRPQVTVSIDRARASTLGVDASVIGDALQIMFGSLQVTRYVDRGEEYDVILQGDTADRRTAMDLENVHVRSATSGALVPLASVVTLAERGTVRELGRVDRLAAITLEGSLGPDLPLGDALTELERIAERELPGDAQIRYTGEALDLQETGSSIYLILLLVVVLVYFVLAGQFESFVHPLIILASVPMAMAGGLITMWIFGLTLNIYTQIALILLVGLVAKNAILIVEFANQLRGEGKNPQEAALGAAALRLRPILMTSVATILGAIPLVLESGAGAEARRTLGAVTSGGLTIGTLLTLFLVPTIYVLLGRFTSAPDERAEALREQEAQAPADDGEMPEGGAPAPRPAE